MDQQIWTISVPEAGKEAGMSKNAAYRAANRGEIPTVRFGKLLRVPGEKFLPARLHNDAFGIPRELSTAAPGFWVLIHRGFLAADRVADKKLYTLHRSV